MAKQAAGAIHSDIERGFIRAEVVHYDDFMQHKSMAVCKEKGIFRLEGKEYLVREGDIINFRFNV
jgi:ribosome-binding ATPase YchF (GTP1/OBG family)